MAYLEIYGGIAQLGERTVRIREVESSNLFVSTKLRESLKIRFSRNFFILMPYVQVLHLHVLHLP